MHSDCFDKWEDLIVGFLAKQGRGRTWSDKQVDTNIFNEVLMFVLWLNSRDMPMFGLTRATIWFSKLVLVTVDMVA